MNAQFRNVQESIRICLLQTYCSSWHGCQTRFLNTESVRRMNTEWKKAVRRIMNLPPTTGSGLRPLIAGVNSVQCQHERRCAMVYNKMLCNENVLVSHVAKITLYNVNAWCARL